MDRRVNRSLIDTQIEKGGQFGLYKYAEEAGVSVSTIEKARAGRVPKRKTTRDKMAKPLGVSEFKLFPVRQDGEEQAS